MRSQPRLAARCRPRRRALRLRRRPLRLPRRARDSGASAPENLRRRGFVSRRGWANGEPAADTLGMSDELAEVRSFTTLQQLVRWAFARRTDVAAVVVQDEYSHDVVLPLGA